LTSRQAQVIYILLWIILAVIVVGFVVTYTALIDIYQHLPGYPWPNEK